jgi:hypothetical protein
MERSQHALLSTPLDDSTRYDDSFNDSMATLVINNREWDVSNLLLSPFEASSQSLHFSPRRKSSRRSLGRAKQPLRDLYPSLHELQRSMPDLDDTTTVDRAFAHSSSVHRETVNPNINGSSSSNNTRHLQSPYRQDKPEKRPSSSSNITRSTLSTTNSFCSSIDSFYDTAVTSMCAPSSSLKPPPPKYISSPKPLAQQLPHKRNHATKQNTQRPQPPQPSRPVVAARPPLVEIEVSPGLFLPLRGSQETMEAVDSGRAMVVHCMACQTSLYCVPDCQLVLCPDCRILSPAEEMSSPSSAVVPCRHSMSMVHMSPDWDDDDDRSSPWDNSADWDDHPVVAHGGPRGVGLGLKTSMMMASYDHHC